MSDEQAIEVYQPGELMITDGAAGDRVGLMIALWLDAKQGRTGSKRTRRAYEDTIGEFRRALFAAGADLDGDGRAIASAAQVFAGRGEVAPATYNHRLAVLSSFYTFAIKRGLLTANPLDVVERRKVESYSDVTPLDAGAVQAALAAIGDATPADRRDRALLTYALTTGRRLAECAALTWGCVLVNGEQVTVIIRKGKGGKPARDKLARKVAAAMLTWRETALLLTGTLDADAPVWIAPNRHGGTALSVRAIEYMALRRLGTQHFHQLRHTFARQLEAAGAKVSEVQARLNHASLQTTSRYLQQLTSEVNPYADRVADALLG